MKGRINAKPKNLPKEEEIAGEKEKREEATTIPIRMASPQAEEAVSLWWEVITVQPEHRPDLKV